MDQILTLWIDSETKMTARVAAARQGVSMSKVIRDAIEEYIKRRPDLFFDDHAYYSTQSKHIASQEQ